MLTLTALQSLALFTGMIFTLGYVMWALWHDKRLNERAAKATRDALRAAEDDK